VGGTVVVVVDDVVDVVVDDVPVEQNWASMSADVGASALAVDSGTP